MIYTSKNLLGVIEGLWDKIEMGEFDLALKDILELCFLSEKERQRIRLLSAQYHHLEREYSLGRLEWGIYKLSWNQIASSLIQIIFIMEENLK